MALIIHKTGSTQLKNPSESKSEGVSNISKFSPYLVMLPNPIYGLMGLSFGPRACSVHRSSVHPVG